MVKRRGEQAQQEEEGEGRGDVELQERVHGQLPDQDLRGGEQARQEEEGEGRGDGRGRGKAETIGLQNETSEAKKKQR